MCVCAHAHTLREEGGDGQSAKGKKWCGWTTLTPCVSSILGLQSDLSPLCVTDLYPNSQGMRPSRVSSLSTFTLAFICYENWKSACLLLTQMVSGHETPRGRKTFGFCCFSLSSQILFLAPAPFKSACAPYGSVRCSGQYLRSIVCPSLPVPKLLTINFIVALYGVACFIFQL